MEQRKLGSHKLPWDPSVLSASQSPHLALLQETRDLPQSLRWDGLDKKPGPPTPDVSWWSGSYIHWLILGKAWGSSSSSICILDFDLVSAGHFLRGGSMHNTVFYQLSTARHPLITLGVFVSLSKCIRHPWFPSLRNQSPSWHHCLKPTWWMLTSCVIYMSCVIYVSYM